MQIPFVKKLPRFRQFGREGLKKAIGDFARRCYLGANETISASCMPKGLAR